LRDIGAAQAGGARLEAACATVGISVRTVQRWRREGGGQDRRAGPKREPTNALSAAERAKVLRVVNSPEFQGLSPKQIVPMLADKGIYLASESTIFRLLRREGQLQHRQPSRPQSSRRKPVQRATGPNQLWSWDITYLKSSLRGAYFFLYLVVDVWSRKIVGWSIERQESAQRASELIWRTCEQSGIDPQGLVLHSDNGTPMKGATMLATLQWLGVVPSFSRPHVKDDNPYSEALFRTLKHRPAYPRRLFRSITEARAWVADFVDWYNNEHHHSGIRFVTPAQRHEQLDAAILTQRDAVYQRARRRHPERWSNKTRDWSPVFAVLLNPDAEDAIERRAA
jgi:transposase InsO family protein